MTILEEEDLKLDYRDFVSWRINLEVCRYTSADVTGRHWSPRDDEWLYIIMNEDWAVGERYYHWNDEIAKHDDPEGFGGNMHWNICNDCIDRKDLVDVLDFEHHSDLKNATSQIHGPCDAPPFSTEWHLGVNHFVALANNRLLELNDYEPQDEWQEHKFGSWRDWAENFLIKQYKNYNERIPSGEYTCDACGIVLNDRRMETWRP